MEADQSRIRLRHFIHVLPAFALAMIGSDICVPESEIFAMLNFSWARLLLLLPWLSLFIYFGLGFWLRRLIAAKAWIVSFVSAAILFAVPSLLLSLNTRSIRVTHYLEPSERLTLKANFPHPFFNYSRTGDGTTLVVKKSDYSQALMDYLRTNHLLMEK